MVKLVVWGIGGGSIWCAQKVIGYPVKYVNCPAGYINAEMM
jgi:hypothetical protein